MIDPSSLSEWAKSHPWGRRYQVSLRGFVGWGVVEGPCVGVEALLESVV